MKISVVIPAYNEEQFIGPCLDALMQQTRKPDEIIVVDNNSSDATARIAERFPVTVLNQEIQGTTPTRNKGFNEASGDIILRTDADSKPHPDWVERMEEHFQSEEVDAVSGPISYYDIPGNHEVRMCNVAVVLLKRCSGAVLLVGPNFGVRKGAWSDVRENVCPNDKLVHEDIDLAMRMKKLGSSVHWDKHLIMPTSGRRIRKKPLSYFGEYPVRFAKTMIVNSELPARTKRTVQKISNRLSKRN